MWEKWENGATRHDAGNSSTMHREAGQARSEHRTAVTQPEDPSLGADTQLTTGYIPSAKKRRIRREGEKKRRARVRSGQKGSDSQAGRAEHVRFLLGKGSTERSVRKERHGRA